MDLNKDNTREKKNQNSPVDVIHGIKEDKCVIFWIHNNIVNAYVLIFVQHMMFVNVPPPSCQPMIPLPYVEHFIRKVSVSPKWAHSCC